MFENILAQDEVISVLRSDVVEDKLPPALLFAGPAGSGKLTAALELARALSCERGASWSCPCPACTRHRLLAHPDLLILGGRSFPEEIPAALELLGRAPGKAASYFFVRAARKLTKRFDAILYEGEESRLAKAAGLVRDIEELLDAVDPERAGTTPPPPGASEAAAKAAAACAKLEAFAPEAPPVFMIRNTEFWARLAPLGPRKTIIVENVDRMQEGARNALLKILEEPPLSVRFVLVAARRSAVMKTILSRARNYPFKARDATETALVLERVFRSGEPAPSVESFLAARRAFPPTAAREAAIRFLGAALASAPGTTTMCPPFTAIAREASAEGHDRASALAALLEATRDFGQKDDRFDGSFKSFLAALASLFGDLLRDPALDARGARDITRWSELAREARLQAETYNRSPSLLAETLLHSIPGDAEPR